jgi:hypothetical protein
MSLASAGASPSGEPSGLSQLPVNYATVPECKVQLTNRTATNRNRAMNYLAIGSALKIKEIQRRHVCRVNECRGVTKHRRTCHPGRYARIMNPNNEPE